MKPKTVRLDAFIENPDNPQTVTQDAFELLVESIRATPQTLAASKIAYATDYIAKDGTDLRGQRVVIAGNKRLRALKHIAATGGLASDDGESWHVTPRGDAPADWFFVTSLSDFLAETRPDLYKVIEDANEENLKATAKVLPKLSFPHAVATSARLQYLTKHGIRFAVKRSDAAFIRRLDAQEKGDAIFGGALLLCERAAAERAAAERAAAERAAAERAAAKTFELSPRELELQKTLG